MNLRLLFSELKVRDSCVEEESSFSGRRSIELRFMGGYGGLGFWRRWVPMEALEVIMDDMVDGGLP